MDTIFERDRVVYSTDYFPGLVTVLRQLGLTDTSVEAALIAARTDVLETLVDQLPAAIAAGTSEAEAEYRSRRDDAIAARIRYEKATAKAAQTLNADAYKLAVELEATRIRIGVRLGVDDLRLCANCAKPLTNARKGTKTCCGKCRTSLWRTTNGR